MSRASGKDTRPDYNRWLLTACEQRRKLDPRSSAYGQPESLRGDGTAGAKEGEMSRRFAYLAVASALAGVFAIAPITAFAAATVINQRECQTFGDFTF